ncbi:phenolic acid decarboxylase [Pantoea sp. AN62]|nr:phenolic acid decarboxylase [Pantoea brenneri]ORM61427.1 phenolic acid decarboxylase [Pantoea brenneri]OXM25696.1 phenolic acid decarboxylase [Pantoea sp. AV62]HAI04575.1 phenolic acid decarboxylase [Pantoea sp.]
MSTFDKNTLSGLVGKHLVYTYDNGWNYELYIKNANTVDYRIHSGMVGNRWVKNQHAYIVRLAQDVYKVSWTEPTGTDVSLAVNLTDKIFHGTIFFPRWVMNNPEKTVCFQNEHLEEMAQYREAGPAYPTEVIDEFATLTFIRDAGENNDSVIDCPASELPADFPANLKN